MQEIANRRVLILGLGASGLAMARWCARAGAQVTVADTRETPPQAATLAQEWPAVQVRTGALDAALVESVGPEALLLSPGLSPAETAAAREAAKACGAWIGGELALFAQGLHALRAEQGYAPQVLAITGTNGKTTVTALTGELVARCGKRVAVAGNIGPTLLDTLAARCDADDLPQVWVLELSSFQLEHPGAFEPTAATVLNLTQDHLDWHGSMAAYAAAKARIFGQDAAMILNRDDPLVWAMAPADPPPKGAPARRVVAFGGGLPARAGDWGLETVHGMTWLVRAQPADDLPRARRAPRAEEPPLLQRLMPADALRIRGRHNALNALAALALATEAGCPLAPMLHGLREYRGEPHRVETVAVVRDVEFIDDSKGTNVGATVAAVNGLGGERKLVLILGGVGKGQDFSPLAEPLARHARAVVLIGRDAPLIRAALEPAGLTPVDAASMADAVARAAALAQPGDAVLMSPACASFDMFRDYGHRAEVFREAVAALAEDAGLSLEGAP